MKFKIGDVVKTEIGEGVISCAKRSSMLFLYQYGVTFDHPVPLGHNCEGFALCAGKHPTGGTTGWFDEGSITLVKRENDLPKNVHITVSSDNRKYITVTKYVDNNPVAKGCAMCDERYDKFDFLYGVKLAYNRMLEDEKKSELFSGKAVALESLGEIRANKMYTFDKGKILDKRAQDCVDALRLLSVTNDMMKNNTGWVEDLFFPIYE